MPAQLLTPDRLDVRVSVNQPPADDLTVTPTDSPIVDRSRLDAESIAWIDQLASNGAEREAAIERLHDLLLRAAHFELARRVRGRGDPRPDDHDDLAVQAADDALMSILRKLPTYRGDSRFTTWAYKFALLEAAVKLRRRAWSNHEMPLEEDGWARLPDPSGATDERIETDELLGAIKGSIATDLTAHQRSVLIAITLNAVPIDVLAAEMNTTRGALYKTLHDARRKLRAKLAADGLIASPDTPIGMIEESI